MISEIAAIKRADIVTTNEVPQLPDTSTWRKVEPGETIPAGTPHMMTNENSYIISKGLVWDTEVSRYESTTYYADLPDPDPAPDLSLIPEGFPNAKLLRINGVVGTWYRHTLDRHVVLVTPAAMSGSGLKPCQVKSVEPVTILGDDEVAVPRAEWEDRSSTRSRAYAWGALVQHSLFSDLPTGDWSRSYLRESLDRLDEVTALVERAQAWLGGISSAISSDVADAIVRDLAALGEDAR